MMKKWTVEIWSVYLGMKRLRECCELEAEDEKKAMQKAWDKAREWTMGYPDKLREVK